MVGKLDDPVSLRSCRFALFEKVAQHRMQSVAACSDHAMESEEVHRSGLPDAFIG